MPTREDGLSATTTDKYKEDGVDIEAGDAFSKYCAAINRGTDNNSMFVKVTDLSRGNFRGPRCFNFQNLPNGCLMTGGMDGVGTKVVPIVASGKVEASASNLIAMTAMDITRYGGLPLLLMNIFDVRSLGEYGSETYIMCQRIMNELGLLAHKHGYVLFNGETAELGVCVGSDNPDAKLMFNWGAAMLGVYHPAKMILGDTLKPGQIIMALRDFFRSNGMSSVRKAMVMKYGPAWYNNPDALADIIACAEPSVQYDRMLNKAHGWFRNNIFNPKIKMHLIIHLSGGAFKSKLGEDMLKPQGLSAELDDLFEPPEIMRKCAEWRGMSDEECYKSWNGGQGAVVVIDPEQVKEFTELAQIYAIEVKPVGRITEQRDYTVAIKSKFGSEKNIYY